MQVKTGIGRRAFVAGSAALALAPRAANAQSFPSGPVKLTVAVGPGSSPDVLLRLIGEHLSQLWGQQAVVINQPGGAGAVAIRAVAATPPDGYSLYMALASNFIALPELQANFPVDVVRDFVPIGYIGEHPMVIAASSSLGVSTLPEFIALAKKRKGELNIAAGNRGSILHLAGEWLRIAGDIDVQLLHYPAASQAITDVLGGRVQGMVDAMTSMKGAVEGGQIKPLAVASKQRLYNFPDLPTVAETFPGFEAMGWFALMAPPGTPAPVAAKISADLRTVLARPEIKKRFEDLGTYIRPMTSEELTAFIREQQQTWRPVIAQTAKKIN
ncbi:Bug family tripartite tricarboxylate transporter substrate binding protein [Rhodoplanes sp. Z2-YC6860]|uniref:Bug family tripartite tricarboxylate transporter substrate binding protein n=1 Tax=Rhodoplanes sp. Z2-YC6860 TaxID=674703 RepID=UPI00078D4453|nr:tripartite tricarboxylate transporter substrate binding protein [Rhodoplanes sp. Z2-YC6860]AMN43248.1 ABC transporter substrate-binding protein [Rhodoplanes sp. Z2-YC6860]